MIYVLLVIGFLFIFLGTTLMETVDSYDITNGENNPEMILGTWLSGIGAIIVILIFSN